MSIQVPANFLELVQRTCKECFVTAPTTVVDQTGMAERMVGWVCDAVTDIETAHSDWGWMFKAFSFSTIAGQSEYTPVQCGITDHENWDLEQIRNQVTSVGTDSEIFMDQIDYNTWRDAYLYGATRNVRSRPLQFAISPTQGLCVGPVPDNLYTVTGKYYRISQTMDVTNDNDVPLMPSNYWMMIVYKAMMYYGSAMNAPEVYARGEIEFGKKMARISNNRLPEMSF